MVPRDRLIEPPTGILQGAYEEGEFEVVHHTRGHAACGSLNRKPKLITSYKGMIQIVCTVFLYLKQLNCSPAPTHSPHAELYKPLGMRIVTLNPPVVNTRSQTSRLLERRARHS